MKLHYWHEHSNFGDQLNPWLWSKLLPGVLDDDPSTLFVGIGTLLNERLPVAPRTVVFGTGVGYGERVPRLHEDFHIYCVRGPSTARRLGVDPGLAITDPGVLVRRFVRADGRKRYRLAYMPHWARAKDGYDAVCEDLGIHFLDPMRPVDELLRELCETEVLLCEAMHGAIVADALGVPWVAIRTPDVLGSKWEDWASSVGLTYSAAPVHILCGRIQDSPLRPLKEFVKRRLVAKQLMRAARTMKPQLSNRAHLEAQTQRLEEKLDQLRADVRAGKFHGHQREAC